MMARQQMRKDSSERKGKQLALQLGWLSIGLGLVEIAAPRQVTEFLGLDSRGKQLVRACGMREIATGLGLLSQRQPAAWVWSRIAGDIMDVAVLSAAFTLPSARRERITAATAMVAGVTALDWLCVQQLNGHAEKLFRGEAQPVTTSIAVNRTPEDVYQFWRDLPNLSYFMKHVISVRLLNEKDSHWVVEAPGGKTVEWDAEITNDQPNELLAWRTLEHAGVKHSGMVRFQRGPGGRGTVVTVQMQYDPPGGVMGTTLASLLGQEPGQQIREDLRRLKQVMETGEVVRSEGSLYGTGLRQQCPGRPPASVPLVP